MCSTGGQLAAAPAPAFQVMVRFQVGGLHTLIVDDATATTAAAAAPASARQRYGSQSSVTDTARVALLATSRGAAEVQSCHKQPNTTTATQAVQRERLEKDIAAVRPSMLRQSMHQTFVEMLQARGRASGCCRMRLPPPPPLPFRVIEHFQGRPASCVIIFRIALMVSALWGTASYRWSWGSKGAHVACRHRLMMVARPPLPDRDRTAREAAVRVRTT